MISDPTETTIGRAPEYSEEDLKGYLDQKDANYRANLAMAIALANSKEFEILKEKLGPLTAQADQLDFISGMRWYAQTITAIADGLGKSPDMTKYNKSAIFAATNAVLLKSNPQASAKI